jgi:hypothetical protein
MPPIVSWYWPEIPSRPPHIITYAAPQLARMMQLAAPRKPLAAERESGGSELQRVCERENLEQRDDGKARQEARRFALAQPRALKEGEGQRDGKGCPTQQRQGRINLQGRRPRWAGVVTGSNARHGQESTRAVEEVGRRRRRRRRRQRWGDSCGGRLRRLQQLREGFRDNRRTARFCERHRAPCR